MDLKLVQTLTAGMREVNKRATEDACHQGCGTVACPNPVIAPRPVVHPEPRIEPRRVIHPTPRVEPRQVIRPEPRIEPAPCITAEPEVRPTRSASPIKPPWRIMPWEIPAPPPPQNIIKPVVRKVDNMRKGSMLDLFI